MQSKIFIVLFFSMLGLTINLHAQTDKQSAAEEKERQRLIQEFKQKKKYVNSTKETSVQVQTNKYNHRETEIFSKLNTPEIPNDFPVYKNEYSNEQYTILMNKWYTANPALFKKESSNEQK